MNLDPAPGIRRVLEIQPGWVPPGSQRDCLGRIQTTLASRGTDVRGSSGRIITEAWRLYNAAEDWSQAALLVLNRDFKGETPRPYGLHAVLQLVHRLGTTGIQEELWKLVTLGELMGGLDVGAFCAAVFADAYVPDLQPFPGRFQADWRGPIRVAYGSGHLCLEPHTARWLYIPHPL